MAESFNVEKLTMQAARRARLVLTALLTGCSAAAPQTTTPPGAVPSPDALVRSTSPSPFAASEYAARRARLAEGTGDGVVLLLGAAEPEADYLTFAQDTDFRYFTGILEPDAALLLTPDGDSVTSRLFVPLRSPTREVWEGRRLGVEGATALTGMRTEPIGRLLPTLDSLLQHGGKLYTLVPPSGESTPLHTLDRDEQVARALAGRHPGIRIVPIGPRIQQLRAAKSAAEIDRIRRAVTITALAQRAAMRAAEPGMNEFELQALIEYTFRRNGAERPSFATIVGSGPNSTALHYSADNRFMRAGEVVVMDIGASYDGYAADVTRTIPVAGAFSPDQRAIYQTVLAAQKAAEARARPGATWQELNAAADSVLGEGLARLGLIDSPAATFRCSGRAGAGLCRQLQLFYMHGLGHGIGLEVHDPDLSYFGSFQAGSVFTIEPGIYIRPAVLDEISAIPENFDLVERIRPAIERFRDIGVRIEDDYLITTRGAERLSVDAPREIDEIQTLMRLANPVAAERRHDLVDWYRALRKD